MNLEENEEEFEYPDEQEDFDFSRVFEPYDEPKFHVSILEYPVNDYGQEDEDEEGPSFGVRQHDDGPEPNRPGGIALDPKKELALV